MPRRQRFAFHSLPEIQAAAASPIQLRFSERASNDAAALGFSTLEVCDVIRSLEPADHSKTMPSVDFPGETLDVYTPVFEGLELWIEFSRDDANYFKLVSFHLK